MCLNKGLPSTLESAHAPGCHVSTGEAVCRIHTPQNQRARPRRARWHHRWPQLALILRSFNWKRLQNCCFWFRISGKQMIQNEQVIHLFVRRRNRQRPRSHLRLSVQTEPLYNIMRCYIWQHWGKQAKVLWTPVLHQRSAFCRPSFKVCQMCPRGLVC